MAFLIIYKQHTKINKRSKKQHDEAAGVGGGRKVRSLKSSELDRQTVREVAE